jgi:hypothetical protein
VLTRATEKVTQLADHFSRAFRRYLNHAGQIRTFDEFTLRSTI